MYDANIKAYPCCKIGHFREIRKIKTVSIITDILSSLYMYMTSFLILSLLILNIRIIDYPNRVNNLNIIMQN